MADITALMSKQIYNDFCVDVFNFLRNPHKSERVNLHPRRLPRKLLKREKKKFANRTGFPTRYLHYSDRNGRVYFYPVYKGIKLNHNKLLEKQIKQWQRKKVMTSPELRDRK